MPIRLAFLSVAAALAATTAAMARTVSVPLTLDHALLRRSLLEQMYTEPGERVRVWDDGSGCNFLVLCEPQVGSEGDHVRIASAAEARVGKRVGNQCVAILDWQGTVVTLGEPTVDPELPIVRLHVVDTELYGRDGRKGGTGRLWDIVKSHVHPRLEQVHIDLNAAIVELRAVLPLVLPRQSAELTDRLLASIALTGVTAGAAGIVATVRFDAPEAAPGQPIPTPPLAEPTLSPEELERWELTLQQWDAFLTFVVKNAARDSSLEELRQTFFAVLVDGRHDLLHALTAGPGEPDPTRRLFLHAWQELAPALRSLSSGLPGEAALRYLSFIAAADALTAIDELGPDSGLEITADGLRRLARVVAPAAEDPLAYSDQVDPELRELFGFGAPLPLPEEPSAGPAAWFGPDSANAAEGLPAELLSRLDRWVPTRAEIDSYLPLLRDVLEWAVRTTLSGGALAESFHPVYRPLVLAAAWQESCWRQFVKIGREISPIVSSAGSVGLMQVNVHVWRGFYDAGALRRDVGYNARAGSEILLRYMKNYAIARGEHTKTGSVDNLARATYAAYNAGPGQLTRYRRQNVAARARRVDAAFEKKYRTIKSGNELAVRSCYGL